MGSRSKAPGARHPRSPLPRQQTVREKLKNVQRKPLPAIPMPRAPGVKGETAVLAYSRSRRMFAFTPLTRGSWNVH
ncbi:MAG: hypothetical protein ABI854_01860 [Betaproteobacteria bacterium]